MLHWLVVGLLGWIIWSFLWPILITAVVIFFLHRAWRRVKAGFREGRDEAGKD